LLPELNERQRRLLVGAEAQALGYGGIEILAEITGMSVPTIRRGIKELNAKSKDFERLRHVGGGRKSAIEKNLRLTKILQEIIEPDTRGDPQTPLRWTCKSVRNIADALKKEKFLVSHQTVASILREMDYSLQSNKKTKEGKDHPDLNQQFIYINKIARKYLTVKDPVISVDTKKKELVGNYKNQGSEWRSKGQPIEVNGHDFPSQEVPKAVPYGVYDLVNDKGWVNVGITSDTAEFAVESIRSQRGCSFLQMQEAVMDIAQSYGKKNYKILLMKSV